MRCHKRLSVSSESFYPDPIACLKSLLGEGSSIVKYEVLSLVTTNSRIIIDVEYDAFIANPLITYYVKFSELTSCTTNSNTYTFKTNDGTNIWLKITNPRSIKTSFIPLTIYPFDKRQTRENSPEFSFKYFATFTHTPLHAYSTFFDKNRYMHSEIDIAETLDSDLAKIKRHELYDAETTKIEYLKAIQKFECLNKVSTIKSLTDFNKLDSNAPINTGYLIDASLLPSDQILEGVIIVQPLRLSTIVFYYPHISLFITPQQVKFVKDLTEIDKLLNLPPDE